MTEIAPDHDGFTVIVTVDVDRESGIMDDLVAHARAGLELFADCDAYVAGAIHLSSTGDRLVHYSRWTSERGYTACRDDDRWEALPSTRTFMSHVHSGRARIHEAGYRVIGSSGT